jgi:formylglycine-generating enzyme required for sulfatase activity
MRRWIEFVGVAIVSIAMVTVWARRDAADSKACGGLVPVGTRCCAEGQREEAGRCVGRPSSCPAPLTVTELGCSLRAERISVAGATLRVGAGDWEAEGREGSRDVTIAPFSIDSIEITQGAYGECVAATRCAPIADSRAFGEPGRAATGISYDEAAAYCAFRGGRLPTSDEWALAAAGSAGRRYPWGDTGAVCRRASWGLRDGPCAFGHVGPELVARHPDGTTPEGVYDLAGNVSEWVASSGRGGEALARGGSFAAMLATDLRTWRTVRLNRGTRSPEVGARCAYDSDAPAP